MARIIIALPGRTFSGKFLRNWTATFSTLLKNGHDVIVVNEYSSFVPFSRMRTLGLDVLRGSEQKPFNGIDYDIWMTFDSDIIFTPEQVLELIEDTNKYPVVSGLYKMQDMSTYPCVREWDTDYFKVAGSFQFMEVGEEKKCEKYIPVVYNGMGFFACRKGVIEKLKYPYFSYPLIEIDAGRGKILKDMCSEDVAFCKNLTDAGFEIIVNTTLCVGHEKTYVI
jgi:hypothetical protein